MEWKEYTFTEVATLTNGRAYLQPELQDSGKYRIVRVGNLSGGDKWFYSDMELPDNKYCNNGDLLYAWACSFGPYIWNNEKTIYHYHIWKVDVNATVADKMFLYYYLKYYTPKWMGLTNGSVMMHITKGSLEKQKICLPPLETQQRISSILSSFDDKIAINRKICANLEAQAQALFKHWFIDFAPFKDGKFVESELGMIPEGWRVGTLFDIANIHDSKRKPLSAMQRAGMEKIYPYYGATEQMDSVDSYLFDGRYVLMGEDGSVVKENGLPYIQYVWGKIWVNNHAHVLSGKDGFTTEMLIPFLTNYNIKGLVTGAVQAKLNQTNMANIKIAIPPINILNECSELFDSIYAKYRQCKLESAKFSSLRDTLLPKLMSGEIKI